MHGSLRLVYIVSSGIACVIMCVVCRKTGVRDRCVGAFRGGEGESVLLLRTARMCVFDWLGYLNNLLTAKLLNRIPFLQIN